MTSNQSPLNTWKLRNSRQLLHTIKWWLPKHNQMIELGLLPAISSIKEKIHNHWGNLIGDWNHEPEATNFLLFCTIDVHISPINIVFLKQNQWLDLSLVQTSWDIATYKIKQEMDFGKTTILFIESILRYFLY